MILLGSNFVFISAQYKLFVNKATVKLIINA